MRLTDLSISTVEEMGWRGIKNGALLDLMAGKFDVLITTDKNLSYQQNLMKRQLAAVVLPTNEIPIVIELLAEIRTTLETIAIGEFREISFPV
jgi:hypothetical protein